MVVVVVGRKSAQSEHGMECSDGLSGAVRRLTAAFVSRFYGGAVLCRPFPLPFVNPGELGKLGTINPVGSWATVRDSANESVSFFG
jgi:hypothetical protein